MLIAVEPRRILITVDGLLDIAYTFSINIGFIMQMFQILFAKSEKCFTIKSLLSPKRTTADFDKQCAIAGGVQHIQMTLMFVFLENTV